MPEDVKPVKKTTDETVRATTAPAAVKPATNGAAAPKKDKTLKIVLIVVGVLVGLGLLATVVTVLFLGKLFKDASDNVSVDNNGTVTLKSDDGTVKTNVGENAKLADGFPSDVPIFEPSTLLASSKTSDSEYSAVAKTAKSVADVTSYYKTQMAAQGWTSQYDSTANDSSLMTFDKDGRTASVVVSNSPEETSNEKTGIVIAVTNKTQ